MTDDRSPQQRLRITFAEGDALKYISHLDLARAWERAFRRARLPLAYSQGYNPRPRFHIAAALPVGVTGRCELLDIWLVDALSPEDLLARLGPVLPPGLELLAVAEVDLRAPSLQSQMRAADYRILVRSEETVEAIRTRISALLEMPALLRQRQHKGKLQTYDLLPFIQSISLQPEEGQQCILTMRLQASPAGAGRPDEVLDTLGLSLAAHTIERTNLHFDFDK